MKKQYYKYLFALLFIFTICFIYYSKAQDRKALLDEIVLSVNKKYGYNTAQYGYELIETDKKSKFLKVTYLVRPGKVV